MRGQRCPKRIALLVLVALATVLPLQGIAAPLHQKRDKHAAHTEILALENQWRTAQLENDVPAMDRLLSDDYLGITSGGDVVTKAQQLERMRARQMLITALDISDIKIKLVGQIAIVNSLARVRGTSDDHPLDGSYRYTRIYQHLPSGLWKITNFEITRIRTLRPGEAPPSEAIGPTD